MPLSANATLNQKMDTIHGRIINGSESKAVLFELAGNKEEEMHAENG